MLSPFTLILPAERAERGEGGSSNMVEPGTKMIFTGKMFSEKSFLIERLNRRSAAYAGKEGIIIHAHDPEYEEWSSRTPDYIR